MTGKEKKELKTGGKLKKKKKRGDGGRAGRVRRWGRPHTKRRCGEVATTRSSQVSHIKGFAIKG